MTELEYRDYEARRMSKRPNWTTHILKNPIACEQESELHQQILDHCRQQWFPWLPLHSRIDRASTVAVGAADFVILLPNGKVVIAECKRKGSKATPAQLAFIAHCKKLGHIAGVVWSFEEFLQLVNQAKAAEKEKAEPANQAKI